MNLVLVLLLAVPPAPLLRPAGSPWAAGSAGVTIVPPLPKPALSAEARRVAHLIGLDSLLDRQAALAVARAGGGRPIGVDELVVRQQIAETVMATDFDIDAVIAEIQQEQARVREVREYLQGRRDRVTAITNLAGLVIGSGLGVVGTAMQFSDRTATAGDVVGVAAGSVATGLSLVAARQQRGPSRPLGPAPNMLAPLFGRTVSPEDAYPGEVWQYLTGDSGPGSSPRDQLLREWRTLGRLGDEGRQKVDQLTSGMNERRPLTIDVLADREAMLGDVHARVALMKRALGEIVRAIGD